MSTYALMLNGDGTPVVHEWDCPAIRANVEQRERPTAGNGTYELMTPYSQPARVTADNLPRSVRYRRCLKCLPPIPESTWTRSEWVDICASSLRVSHIGKEFDGIGRLESFTVGEGYVHCAGAESSLACLPSGRLKYRRVA